MSTAKVEPWMVDAVNESFERLVELCCEDPEELCDKFPKERDAIAAIIARRYEAYMKEVPDVTDSPVAPEGG